MATNKVFEHGDQLSLVCDDPATPASNDPVRIGLLVGVATTDERADGTTSVDLAGVYDLSVEADAGAIAPGDELFYTDANTPKISNTGPGDASAGHALEAVTALATATIRVRLHG